MKDGVVGVATNPAQRARLEASVAYKRRYGWSEADLVTLTGPEVHERVRVAGVLSGTWSPHCARIHPARLVNGLAGAVRRRGAQIYEQTTVERVEPGVVHTDHGKVRAAVTIHALEGYTPTVHGRRRTWLPMSSSMIVTEPLPSEVRKAIGWSGAELLGDAAHGYAYLQRTRDGRIALGGRALPYRYASRTDRRGETMGDTVDQLRDMLVRLFPTTHDVEVAHAWAGVLGVPRDWCATVGLDESTGMGWAGGYVGHGVTSTNLAGRTLADLLPKRQPDLIDLPLVGRKVRRWEPEPARWIAVRSLYSAYALADRREARAGTRRHRPSQRSPTSSPAASAASSADNVPRLATSLQGLTRPTRTPLVRCGEVLATIAFSADLPDREPDDTQAG